VNRICVDHNLALDTEQRVALMQLPQDPCDLRHFPDDGREFVCGCGAAAINIVTTFPLNKLIFRQQIYAIDASTALRQLRQEGPVLLYRGVLPPLVQKTSTLSIMFGMYDQFNRLLTGRCGEWPLRFRQATSAVLAGCLEATLTPFERIQTLLQDRHYHGRYRNMAHAAGEIGRRYGIREYYRGLTAILLRNGPSNAVFFLLRNEMKQRMPPARTAAVEFAENFVCGGILGAFISTVFFPMNVVKIRMQSRVGGNFESFSAALAVIYRERNRSVALMFRGAQFNCVRSLISWGVINASYELLKQSLYGDSVQS